jgi:hypothetical protein
MVNSRTYIFVRIWESFPADLDLSALGNVSDDVIENVILHLHAHGIRLVVRDPQSSEATSWVEHVPAVPPDLLAHFGDEWCKRLAISHLAHATSRGRIPETPRWQLIHAESSPARARALIAALDRAMPMQTVVHAKWVKREDVPLAESLCWDRDLNEWDARNIKPGQLLVRRSFNNSLLKRIHDDAIKFSALLKDVPEETVEREYELPAASPDAAQSSSEMNAAGSQDRGRATAQSAASSNAPLPGDKPARERRAPQTWHAVVPNGLPLRGWHRILGHLHTPNTRKRQEELRRRNHDLHGPIRALRGRPEVDVGQLDEWLRSCTEGAAQTETVRKNRARTVTDLEEREGADMPSQGLHVKRR